jgi:hypothetical protein
MADNRQIKDGIGNLFTLRMKDVSSTLDGSLLESLFLSTPYPPDYGGGGIFQHCAKSGVLNAALPANSAIYSFRWPASTILAAITRVRLFAWTAVGFAPGMITFDLFVARNFTAPDTGGTGANLTGDNNNLRTVMGSAEAEIMYSNTLGLALGTRTLDLAPIDSRTVAAPTTPNMMFNPPSGMTLFEKLAGEHPLIVMEEEGFVIQATVPATGTWQFALTLEWAELPAY